MVFLQYYKDYSTLEYSQKVRDEHRKRWAVGDWTDDSDQMLLIMLSLVENDGEVATCSLQNVVKSYIPSQHST